MESVASLCHPWFTTTNLSYRLPTFETSATALCGTTGKPFVEGSLEVKLPTIWTDEKQRWGRKIEKRRAEERRSEKRKSQKKEDAGARKGRKVAKHCVFPMICGSRGSKAGSLKRRVRSQLARWEMKNCTPLWREAHFQVKMYKTHHSRTTFGNWDV